MSADHSIGIRRFSRDGRKLRDEIAFLEGDEFPAELLADLSAEAERLGTSAEAVLLARGLIDERGFYRRLAGHLGVPFFEKSHAFAMPIHWREALASGHARLADGSVLIAPRGLALVTILQNISAQIHAERMMIAAPRDFESCVIEICGREMADAASYELAEKRPDLCARDGLGDVQKTVLALVLAILAVGLAGEDLVWTLFFLILGCLMFLAVVLRLSAVICSFFWTASTAGREDGAMPTYSILVALYREAHMVPQLISALRAIDYPAAKCEFIFLLEQDDDETRAALEAACLPASFRTLVVPLGWPRTKPRALNFGLSVARGELIVIYDAEDRPEPDQLRKAARIFSAGSADLACLQASLVIDNCAQSWLTRLFALDYAGQFDVVMRGFSKMGLPFPLGGTSNHFRAKALRDIGGWDAWNVTEDADLGLRLARFGYRTRMLDSATFEEAPAYFGAWFPQRRRWMKGWLHTLLTHTRYPMRLFRELGPVRGAHVLALLLSHTFGPLAGIWFTAYVLHDAWMGDLLEWQENLLQMAAPFFWASLASIGLLSIVIPTFIGAARRGLWLCLPWLILRPLHWLCLSAAALSAIYELCRHPFYWAKTPHGISTNGGQDRP